MLTSLLNADKTPLDRIANRVLSGIERPNAASNTISILAYSGAVPKRFNDDLLSNNAGKILLWGIEPNRVRIGPLVGSYDTSCVDCFLYWLENNRPDKEIWRSISPHYPVVLAEMPWIPLHYQMIEAVSERFLADGQPGSFVDLEPETLQVQMHHYQPSPSCPRCSPCDNDAAELVKVFDEPVLKPDSRTYRTSRLPSAKRLRELYVDYRVGLVSHMFRESNSPILPMWGAENQLPDISARQIGYGRNESAHVSESVAILETLERYSGMAPRARNVTVRGSYADLAGKALPAVDPRSFVLCSDAQQHEPGYDLVPYSESLVCDWFWAYSCRRKEPVLVPLQLCFYGNVTPSSERFVLETSNGCALGNSLAEAALHGLLEVIERDAYLTRWYLQAAAPRIQLNDSTMPDVQRLYARTCAEGYDLKALDIHIEVPIPVVLAMIMDHRIDAAVSSYCASAAHPKPSSAIMGALAEVCSSILIYKNQFAAERERARELCLDGSLVREMRDHVLLYSLPESVERLSFLDYSTCDHLASSLFHKFESLWSSTDLLIDLQNLVEHVCKIADDVIIVDQTSSILTPSRLHCVKVIAPGLHPITFGHQYRRISDRRLAEARAHIRKEGGHCESFVNPYPHNFP